MKKILVNTGSNVSVVIVKLIITFIMTPVFVHNLGNYDYGIWEVISAVLGYMGLLDMGMKPAISRFAAKYRAENKPDKLKELYSTAFVFLFLVGLMLCLFFVLWAIFWPELLSDDGAKTLKYSLLLYIIAVQLLVVFPGFVAESFLEGFQKYYLKNNITIINSVIGSTILFIVITPANALVVLAGINALGLLIKYFIYMYMMSQEKFGGIKPSLSRASMNSFRETAGFGVKSLIQGIASRIEVGTDTIVISFFLGPAMVPFYAIPANLISYVRNIGWTLTHAFMPLFSELHAKNKAGDIQKLYLSASRYVVALLLPVCVGITIIGPDFIGVWVGEEYTKDARIIILLLVLYMTLPFLNPFSTRYLTAINKHELLARLYPVSAVVNLVASIILVQYWGITGVAIGSAIPVFVLMPAVLKAVCGYLGITIRHYIVHSILPSVGPTILMWAAVSWFRHQVPLDGYTEIILAIAAGAVVYAIMFYLLGMGAEERKWVKMRVSNLFAAIGR